MPFPLRPPILNQRGFLQKINYITKERITLEGHIPNTILVNGEFSNVHQIPAFLELDILVEGEDRKEIPKIPQVMSGMKKK